MLATPVLLSFGVPVYKTGNIVTFTAGGSIDADGAYRAYKLEGGGLDNIMNAHSNVKDPNSKWVGVVLDSTGRPVVQGANDPAPGYLVSQTAWRKPGASARDPRGYLDAETFPYIVVNEALLRLGVKAWDFAEVSYGGVSVAAVVGDTGRKLGEFSIGTAKKINEKLAQAALTADAKAAKPINPSPKNGGVSSGVSYKIWTGSNKGWPLGLNLEGEVAALSPT